MSNSKIPFDLPMLEETAVLFSRIWESLQTTNQQLDAMGLSVFPVIYESSAISVHVRRVAETHYELFVPVGLFDRVFCLAFLYMAALDVRPAGMIFSLRDRHVREGYIPRLLRPVFRPEGEHFSRDIGQLLATHCRGHLVPMFLRDVMLVSSFFVAQHEIGHIANRHFDIADSLERGRPFGYSEDTLGLRREEILEGFEVHADQEACRYTAAFIRGALRAATGQPGDSVSAHLANFTIGLALLITLFDHKSRSLDTRGAGAYPHPLVRWTLVKGAIAEELAEDGLDEEFLTHADQAALTVTNLINGLFFSELARDYEQGETDIAYEDVVPIAQLNADKSLVGQSVLFEHVIQSSERGRRVVFTSQLLSIPVDMAEEWRRSEKARSREFIERMRKVRRPE